VADHDTSSRLGRIHSDMAVLIEEKWPARMTVITDTDTYALIR
jgi:hypothetical protein